MSPVIPKQPFYRAGPSRILVHSEVREEIIQLLQSFAVQTVYDFKHGRI
jgi:hypothetical protein